MPFAQDRAMKHLIIRQATVADAVGIRDIFIETYGRDYPYSEMYDVRWLQRALADDAMLVLVAELRGRLVGTGWVFLGSGPFCDLIGEFGRLVVTPDMRRHGIGTRLFEARVTLTQPILHFGFVQARTVHPFAQRISEKCGFAPVGFLPSKSQFARRESLAVMVRLFGPARTLRRPRPRLTPEILPLARAALRNLHLSEDDIIVERETKGYHVDRAYSLEEWSEMRLPDLVELARDCNKPRRVYSRIPINYRIFRLHAAEAIYLLAKQGDALHGALGFVYDPGGRVLRIIELIGRNDGVIGFLLEMLNRFMAERLDVAYAEIIVSAYNPVLQRTMLDHGFFPVAYYPAYVMRSVERLDAVRLAKLRAPLEGGFELIPSVDDIYDIVLRNMEAAARDGRGQ
ncbi:MAG TPA: GNAT family N-acetyltransferase [Anaerolineae bacterium]|nr:GNAT family N-acetyltransferase [Anaerolineae bacterium]